ncbi:hypothetical protein J4Q44_G00016300 [Coregonus suidteri]|uniref:PiggyBac transposable element-derived protein domain-containing protein n=1 Tax=Coregonus suidteri TaxID=861788 RepID=A0AAN8R5H9_9TELE
MVEVGLPLKESGRKKRKKIGGIIEKRMMNDQTQSGLCPPESQARQATPLRHGLLFPLSDALIGYYSVHHKTMKWYKTFLFLFVDIAVGNSFLLHKELHKNNPTKPYTQKKFREKLLTEMVSFAKQSEPQPPPRPPPTSCMPEYYGDDASKDRKNCRRWLDVGIPKVKTPVYCRKCQVPLCITSKRNCFKDWHDSKF